ncbi:MAG: DUF58 domain-containing protein [Planctomycetota bacterium]
MIDGLLSFLGLRRASGDVESYDDDLDALLDEVRRIEAFARRLVRGVLAGGYTSVFRGAGLEFDVVREYEPGDDPRSVDWNVTARTGRPFVRSTSTSERCPCTSSSTSRPRRRAASARGRCAWYGGSGGGVPRVRGDRERRRGRARRVGRRGTPPRRVGEGARARSAS